ncbi:MAG: alcohol dehydrogenase catalytic domain-containing protein [Rhodobacteraceae bacterium]|nr:alcohol dehydrogenase catalytic domain-containing protein [Paracoccaceae bacterium]
MCDEYPCIPYPQDRDDIGYDGIIEENMMICVEGYVGSERGGSGVKIEHQYLVTANGLEQLDDYPYDENLLNQARALDQRQRRLGMSGVPETMRAVVPGGHGGPDIPEYHDDWPTPNPKPGEVLIRVGVCGLNSTGINTCAAWYSRTGTDGIAEDGGKGGFDSADEDSGSRAGTPLTFPRIQGADVAGHIAAVGTGVDPGRIGQRVLIDPWLHGHGDWHLSENTWYFGLEFDGDFAVHIRVRAGNAIPVTRDLSDARLATFPATLTTAKHPVWRTAPQPGERAVISGPSGGAVTTAIQAGAGGILPAAGSGASARGVHHHDAYRQFRRDDGLIHAHHPR